MVIGFRIWSLLFIILCIMLVPIRSIKFLFLSVYSENLAGNLIFLNWRFCTLASVTIVKLPRKSFLLIYPAHDKGYAYDSNLLIIFVVLTEQQFILTPHKVDSLHLFHIKTALILNSLNFNH